MMTDSSTPAWLNTQEYPFARKYFPTPQGRIHYVDEGQGAPIVFLHGNPGWSYEYRKIIREMSRTHRCIAPDYLGFGLSDKPQDWDYKPASQAQFLEDFLDHLNLPKFTLVFNDWGGPLGLAYALKHPEKIHHLVITNSWFWPVNRVLNFVGFSAMAGGPLGRFMAENFNVIGRVLSKAAYGPRAKMPREVQQHYAGPHGEPGHRKGTWVFPREIIKSTPWLETLWNQREKIQDIPASILWGDSDIAFKDRELKVWTALMKHHTLKILPRVGHYPPEEAPEEVIQVLKEKA